MPNFLLVPIGTKTGLTSISLGLLRALQRSGRRPVYYKPVSHKPTPAGDTDRSRSPKWKNWWAPGVMTI